jgi:hypothetical protein
MTVLQRHPYTGRTVVGFAATNCSQLTVAQPSAAFHCTLYGERRVTAKLLFQYNQLPTRILSKDFRLNVAPPLNYVPSRSPKVRAT